MMNPAKRYSLWDKFLFRDKRDQIASLEREIRRAEIKMVVCEVLEEIQRLKRWAMTYWVNVYENGRAGCLWESRELAVEYATSVLRAAYRIKVTLKGKA